MPPRKPPSSASRPFPRKAMRPRLAPLGGAGSARPRRHHRSTQACFRLAICLGLAPLGGAGSARPQGRHNANSTVASSWPLAHPQRMWRKWNASAYVRPCHADARSASLRENRPPRYFRPFPARPSELGSPIRRRGGLRTPTITPTAPPRHVPGRPLGHRQPMLWKWNASAYVRPCRPDAQTAPLRENRTSPCPRVFPARPSHLGPAPRGDAGSAQPRGNPGASGASPSGYRSLP